MPLRIRAQPVPLNSAKFHRITTVLLTQRNLSTTASRSYAAPARPGKPPTPSQQDADMWKSYTKALQTKFFGNLNPNTEAFYAAPIALMGIPASNNIPQEITNKAVCDVGDTLMQLNTPVFGSGDQKYIQRLQGVLGAVKVKRNADMGAEKRFKDAQARSRKIDKEANELRKEAMAEYTSDESKGEQTFTQWVGENFPSLVSLTEEQQAAASTEASLRAQMEGPGAAGLNRQRKRILDANDLGKDNPGLNMPCTTAFGNIIDGTSDLPEGSPKLYRPVYTIDGSYRDAVENWIRNAGDDDKFNLTYRMSDAKSDKWEQYGMTNVSANAGGSYGLFFKVRYTVNHQTKEEHITAQEAGSELSIQITATDVGTFTVKPGDWDVPNPTEQYPQFEVAAAMDLGPAARVDQVLMGYKVGMKISVSTKMAERIKDLTSKAMSTGGGVSFFGYDIGFGGSGSSSNTTIGESMTNKSSSTSIVIPGKDFGYPVLLGVKGKKLAGIKAGK